MTIYVYSTLANDNKYTLYEEKLPNDSSLPAVKGTVLIKGGTGVADKNGITPNGVVTEITEDQLMLLEVNPVFKMHKDKGFIVVTQKEIKTEKVVADMKDNDPSRPVRPSDYTDDKGPKPKLD